MLLSNASFLLLLNMSDALDKRNITAKTQLACIVLLCPGQGSHITKSVLDSAGPGGNIRTAVTINETFDLYVLSILGFNIGTY